MNSTSPNLIREKFNEIATLSDSGMEMLLGIAAPQTLNRGQFLLKEGQVCRNFYFIETGQLRTFFNKEGKDINLNFSFESHFLTNLKSLLLLTPSAFNIQASEKTLVWKFDRDKLFELYNARCDIESFGRKLVEMLLIKQEEHSNLFKLYTPAERYHYVAKYHPKLLQRVSLSQLSSYLGISRETVSRIRKKRSFAY